MVLKFTCYKSGRIYILKNCKAFYAGPNIRFFREKEEDILYC